MLVIKLIFAFVDIYMYAINSAILTFFILFIFNIKFTILVFTLTTDSTYYFKHLNSIY